MRLGLLPILPCLILVSACNDENPVAPKGAMANPTSVVASAMGQSDTWASLPQMPTARSAGAVAINGLLYVVGGKDQFRADLTDLQVYDPAAGTWATRAPIPTGRWGMGVAAVNGILYAAGGQTTGSGAMTTVLEAYDPATNMWSSRAPLPEPLIHTAAASINGVLYVVGGVGISPQTSRATLYAYRPATNSWTTRSSMPTARNDAATAVVAGKLYVIGGYNGAVLATVEVYDPVSDTWSTVAPMPARRFGAAAAGIGPTLYVMGGYVDGPNEGALGRFESYDPATDTWRTLLSMPTARNYLAAVAINGTVYAVGGVAATGYVTAALEAYTPGISLSPAPAVIAGGQTTCVVRADTTLKCWGTMGSDGEPEIAQVTVGNQHICALKTDGSLICWGASNNGQLPIPSSLGSAIQVSAGFYATCVVLATTDVQCWGGGPFPATAMVPDSLTNVKQVVTGYQHSCALKDSGTVICWGYNDANELNVPADLNGVSQISLGSYHTCARKNNGSVVCWGGNHKGQASPPSNLSEVKSVSAGVDNSCALRNDGTVTCWGDNSFGQTNVPAGLNSVIQISSGARHTCAMRADFTVACWGHNDLGQASVPIEFQLQTQSNTPAGTNVPVELLGQDSGAIRLTFSSVLTAGQTIATPLPMGTSTAPPAPSGFLLEIPGTFYEISTAAQYGGSVEVCITYTGMSTGNEYALRLLHYTNETWTDITSAGYPNFALNKICGMTNSFSPFLVAEMNEAPAITSISLPPAPIPLGTAISATASFTDTNKLESHTGSFGWSDASSTQASITETRGSGTASATHTYGAVGVYTITAHVTDAWSTATRSSSADIPGFVVVYDPAAGFVTGGGWINSTPGSYSGNPAAAGKATFGFVSRYSRGKTVPEGNTEFSFNTAQFKFMSTAYEWLVISGGKASYRGTGQIDGAGSYNFLLTAVDGEVAGGGTADRFRIKIWNRSTGEIVYDNQRDVPDDEVPSSTLGGGNIIIHK